MESYQPWPIFNVQNELAGVQKMGSYNSNQVNDTQQFFFSVNDWAAPLLPCPHPPLSTIILHQIYFPFKARVSMGGGQLKVRMICMYGLLCEYSCMLVRMWIYIRVVILYVCMFLCVCWLGGEDTQEMCQQNSTRGELATHSWEPLGRLNRWSVVGRSCHGHTFHQTQIFQFIIWRLKG